MTTAKYVLVAAPILCACAVADDPPVDLKRQMSLSGSRAAVQTALERLEKVAHQWSATIPRPAINGSVKVVIRWSNYPSYREIGQLIYTAQVHNLQIGDTELVEQR